MDFRTLMSGIHTDELLSFLEHGKERAREAGYPLLISLAQKIAVKLDPIELFHAGAFLKGYRNFWANPVTNVCFVSFGATFTITADGEERLDIIRNELDKLFQGSVVDKPNKRGVGPLLFGGLRFDPLVDSRTMWNAFPDALFVLPEFLFTWFSDECWVTFNVLVLPDMETESVAQKIISVMDSLTSQKYVEPKQPIITQQSPNGQEEWATRVQQALRDIEAGKLSKLVLARKLELEANTPFSLTATLQHLLTNYHECTVFAFDNGQSSFVGATPESLVRLDGDVTSLDCLAGTATRGKTEEEDKAISEELMANSKERREHSTTVTMVVDTLNTVCHDLQWDKTPKIIRLKNVQHLETSFSGHVNDGIDILNLLDLLHPTPAVGGTPTDLAVDSIRKIEGDRGWYAAPVGWFDCNREGEFSVAIRSALLSSNRAVLFAGAGIVEGSDPEREFNETELKFQPLFAALARS